jgi:hypothetical protein
MLLVDEHKSQILRREAGLEQRVSAYEERWALRAGAGDLGWMPVPGSRLPAPGLEFDLEAERLKPIGESKEMLFRQDFGWGHESNAEAGLEGHERATCGHNGFAGTDIALQQAAHGVPARHVFADFAEDFSLSASEVEPEAGEERPDEMVVPAAG